MASLVKAVYLIARNKEEEATRWYETFYFERRLNLWNSPNDINGIVFKFNHSKAQKLHQSLEKAPLIVFALRGTGNEWGDVLLTAERNYCNLRVWKTIISIKNLFIQNPEERQDKIWLVGDSLGATIATYTGLSIAEENKIYLKTFLFNPPFTNSNLFDRVPNDALEDFDNQFKPSTLFGRAIRRFLVWPFVGDMKEAGHPKVFSDVKNQSHVSTVRSERYVMNGVDDEARESISSELFLLSFPKSEKKLLLSIENHTVVFCNSSKLKVICCCTPLISMSGCDSSSPSSSYEHITKEKMGEDCDEDEILANFLESEILSVDSSTATSTAFEQQPERDEEVEDDAEEEEEDNEKEEESTEKMISSNKNKKRRGCNAEEKMTISPSSYMKKKLKITIASSSTSPPVKRHLATTSSFGSCYISGRFSNVPPELFHNIIKFLSPEDLISCSLVCRFMNAAASDDSLWRRLYCMRWGLASPACKLHTCPWKKLYIQRDKEDMVQFVRNTPSEFKEYYIQMQAAKRSQAPLPSQVNDDRILLDKTISEQVSIWKSKRGLSDMISPDHVCSGNTCTYYQIGDVFLCEKTGTVHVCDDTCREVILDPVDEVLVCTISGHCFDRLLCPDEELDTEQQAGMTDEAEPFLGSGRFARAYLLGYNCADEKELEATLRFC